MTSIADQSRLVKRSVSERARKAAARVLRNPLNSKQAKVERGECLTQRSTAHSKPPKYVARRPKHRVSTTMDDWEQPKAQTVHESEPRPTGLLDQHGNEIYRMPDRIGFDLCR